MEYGPWIKIGDDSTILNWDECGMPDCGRTAMIEIEGKKYCRDHAHAFEEVPEAMPEAVAA